MPDLKARLRTEALSRRQAAHGEQSAAGGASAALAVQGLSFLDVEPPVGTIVSGFSAIRDEIDPELYLDRLSGDGLQLALPVMQGKGKRLLFRAHQSGDPLQKTVWGIPEPLSDKPLVEPYIVLVPLLAFDAKGFRLGYGGGFYDRTLADLRAKKPIIAIGIAYNEQLVDAVPHEPYDQRLDWVLTPSGAFRCSGL